MTVIVVSGASGRLGGRVARRLDELGEAPRVVVRDRNRAPKLSVSDVAVADFDDGEALRRALAGADVALMVSAAETPDRVAQHRNFVDAAVAADVRHLVYTSFVGAAPDATFTLARDHWATEEHIRASGLPFTFLRDNLYADFVPFLVGEDGVIRGPAGDGRAAVVAQDDIADAAVAILRSPTDHVGLAYEMSGPEALSMSEIAQTVAAATGRAVSYHDESLDEAYESRAQYNAPGWQVDAWVSTYTAIAAGEMATVTADVERLTGRPATSLRTLLS